MTSEPRFKPDQAPRRKSRARVIVESIAGSVSEKTAREIMAKAKKRRTVLLIDGNVTNPALEKFRAELKERNVDHVDRRRFGPEVSLSDREWAIFTDLEGVDAAIVWNPTGEITTDQSLEIGYALAICVLVYTTETPVDPSLAAMTERGGLSYGAATNGGK